METQRVIKRNLNLDLVKILACIFVIGLHALNYPEQPVSYTLYQFFGYAIPFFYMASGYMLLNKKGVTGKYVIGKIQRVLRFVLLWNIFWQMILFICDMIGGQAGFSSILGYGLNSIWDVWQNCFLQRGFFFQFWYMGTTIILYLLLPLLYKVKAVGRKEESSNTYGGLIGLWIFFLVVSIMIQAASMILGYPVPSLVLQSLRIWCSLQYFLIGAFMPGMIKKINEKLTIQKHAIWTVLAVAVSVVFRITIGIKCINNIYAEFFYDDPLFIVSAYLLFTLVMRLNLSDCMQKMVRICSPLIMGVYAVHMIILKFLNSVIPNWNALQQIGIFVSCVVINFGLVMLVRKIRFTKYWFEL